MLDIKKMRVSIEGKIIVRDLTLAIKPGELHVLMGPNGSGKSTIAHALLGHPRYRTAATRLRFNSKDIRKLKTDARARLGLFLGFQYPLTVSGVTLANLFSELTKKNRPRNKKLLHLTLASRMATEQREAQDLLRAAVTGHMRELALPEDMLYRGLNDGFSGGEKKKAEMLQMLALKPKLAILDEPDSGVDIDALKAIAKSIAAARKVGTAILLITHYQRILKYLKPDAVHIMVKGKLVRSGTAILAREIEKKGYAFLQKK
ncbi:MAG: Fe-S cluster assembly ATPase SufC [Candidatus Komeilibacteria bacterium]|nr:Fe-S cluster assembly ATPase SufC [Candidatus Komeilibacteria bacterium]